MKLKRFLHTKKKAAGNKTEQKTESVLSALTPGLCFDFHPTVSCSQKFNKWRDWLESPEFPRQKDNRVKKCCGFLTHSCSSLLMSYCRAGKKQLISADIDNFNKMNTFKVLCFLGLHKWLSCIAPLPCVSFHRIPVSTWLAHGKVSSTSAPVPTVSSFWRLTGSTL